jgi:MFS family permease
VWKGLAEGFAYAFGFAPIRALLLLVALVSMMAMPISVLLPVFASKLLRGGPSLLGLMTGATGIGALASAIYLASRRQVVGLGKLISAAAVVLGLGMIGFSLSRSVPLSLAMLVVTGFCTIFQMAGSNTLLQTIVDEDKRGRVMSLYVMAFVGAAPFGSLLAGVMADRYSAPLAIQVGAAACMLGGATFALNLPRLREQVRPIYERTGILPAAARANQMAAELSTPPEDLG